jgi:hypothetical protein
MADVTRSTTSHAYQRGVLAGLSRSTSVAGCAPTDLEFVGPEGTMLLEKGRLRVFVGGDSTAGLMGEFELV